jgi:photosystem II stability/assembly factor-like uncharacterized protein
MKRLIFSFLILLLISFQSVYSQSGWFWQNPLPQGNSLNGVKFVNGLTGIAVGSNGIILRTSDGGLNWIVIENNAYYGFSSISIVDLNILIAVGTSGTIYKTSNSGLNWHNIISGTTYDFTSVFFVDQNTGFAAGVNILIKSTNGGDNWFVPGGNLSKNIRCIYFLNASTGWFTSYVFSFPSGHNEIYKTENGGVTWILQFDYTLSSAILFKSILFKNQNTGWCSPNFKTTNSGTNWLTESNSFDEIFFYNSNKGWKFSSINEAVYKTSDGGLNWILRNCYENNLNEIHFSDSINGFCVGQYGRIIRTTNGGEAWNKISKGYYNDINSLNFIDTLHGWAGCTKGTVFRTTNSGMNWDAFFIGDSSVINQISFASPMIGYAVNWSGNTVKTTNGGSNWYKIDTSGYIPRSVYFINENTGWVGDLNKISKTTNGGSNWNQVILNGIWWVSSFCFLNSQTGWAAGSNIFKTTNGGDSWYQQSNSSEGFFKKVYFTSELNGWTFKIRTWGDNYIYRTTNGGLNWTQVKHIYMEIGDILVVDSLNAIIVGESIYDSDSLMRTYNGGLNWFALHGVSKERFWTSATLKSNKFWLGGTGGAILRTTDLGGNPIGVNKNSKNTPSTFALSQNYPNPFNPVTKIKYSLPNPSPANSGINSGGAVHVKLIIYDILGREIETLVDENKKPGNYEMDWDGSRFSSGVYFYKLVTDDWIATKKMVLIK